MALLLPRVVGRRERKAEVKEARAVKDRRAQVVAKLATGLPDAESYIRSCTNPGNGKYRESTTKKLKFNLVSV